MARTDQRTKLIKGTVTNDNADAGYVGEVARSAVGPTNFPTSTQWGDITSISLTAGDWDVTGVIYAQANSATVTKVQMAITTTSGNSTAGFIVGDNAIGVYLPTNTADSSGTIPSVRVSLSETTVVYLKFNATFSAATPQAYGRISARRIR